MLKKNHCRFLIILILFVFATLFFPTKKIILAAVSSPAGLGQGHIVGGPITSNPGIYWAYSSSTPFGFSSGEGDSWAAIEPRKREFFFNQIEGEVNLVKSLGKKVWPLIQTAGDYNKEHNVPKWLLDEGVELVVENCGEPRWVAYNWSEVAPYWDNPQYVDQTEAVRFAENNIEKVKFPIKYPAVWDPKFITYYLEAVAAFKHHFAAEIESGVVSAFNLASGGSYGEHNISVKCPAWTTDCTPDVLNSQCPIVQSMARVKGKSPSDIARKSTCEEVNTIPGNEVKICQDTNQSNCPQQFGSYCFVFDDYYIQAMKILIKGEVEIFNSSSSYLPLVWHDGSGASRTGRTARVLRDWFSQTYGDRVWIKSDAWNPHRNSFNSANFNIYYGNTTRHGYEAGVPNYFSRSYWASPAVYQTWCSEQNPQPAECLASPVISDEIAKKAIAQAIKKAIVDDKSSFLALQTVFFEAPNDYFFNASDQSQNCTSSEINVAKYGAGFCPGYLNYILSQAPSSTPAPTIILPTPTLTLSCLQQRKSGDYNCNNTIEDVDFEAWKTDYLRNLSTLSYFEYWRRVRY